MAIHGMPRMPLTNQTENLGIHVPNIHARFTTISYPGFSPLMIVRQLTCRNLLTVDVLKDAAVDIRGIRWLQMFTNAAVDIPNIRQLPGWRILPWTARRCRAGRVGSTHQPRDVAGEQRTHAKRVSAPCGAKRRKQSRRSRRIGYHGRNLKTATMVHPTQLRRAPSRPGRISPWSKPC